MNLNIVGPNVDLHLKPVLREQVFYCAPCMLLFFKVKVLNRPANGELLKNHYHFKVLSHYSFILKLAYEIFVRIVTWSKRVQLYSLNKQLAKQQFTKGKMLLRFVAVAGVVTCNIIIRW